MSHANSSPMLEGIKVIDLTSVVFGPYCTQILSDLGADVVKIEPPTGDAFRWSLKSANSKGMSPGHIALNRGKRSVALDLKQDGDKKALLGLITGADIFIHNIRDDAISRLGLDYDSVKAVAPDIIYIHCVGFGSDGPYSGMAAYDDIIQAATGAVTLLPRADGNQNPRYLPSVVADKVAGLNAVYATQAAIIHKLRTGEGQFVEVPMFESFTNFILKEHLAGLTFEPPTGSVCYDLIVDPSRQPFPTADGYISIVPNSQLVMTKLFELLGDPDFVKQEKFRKPGGRDAHLIEIYGRIGELTRNRKTAEWHQLFLEKSIPSIPVRDIGDIMEDSHLQAVKFFQKNEHPTEGSVREMREAAKFSAWSKTSHRHAPAIGEHSEEILAGISEPI